jgi:mRNA interferase RelE/StbE
LADYKIAETETFQKKINSHTYHSLYSKITDYVYPLLRKNPYFGPHIKRLKGNYKDIFRFRIGDYRLFYKIEEEKVIILRQL